MQNNILDVFSRVEMFSATLFTSSSMETYPVNNEGQDMTEFEYFVQENNTIQHGVKYSTVMREDPRLQNFPDVALTV